MSENSARGLMQGLLQVIDTVIGDSLATTNAKPPEPAIYFSRPQSAPHNNRYPYVVVHRLVPSSISEWGLANYIDTEDCVDTTELNRYSLFRFQIYDNKDQFTALDILEKLHSRIAGLDSVRYMFCEFTGSTLEQLYAIQDRTFQQKEGWVYSWSFDISLVTTEIVKDEYGNYLIKTVDLELDLKRHEEGNNPLKIKIVEPSQEI